LIDRYSPPSLLACEAGCQLDQVPAETSARFRAANLIASRGRHSMFMNALVVAAGSLERGAVEVRYLRRTEVGEAAEPFGSEHKGSSAMPHGRNPDLPERVCGLARVVRGYATAALEDIDLAFEGPGLGVST
jgi:adenylosuccinate lyase